MASGWAGVSQMFTVAQRSGLAAAAGEGTARTVRRIAATFRKPGKIAVMDDRSARNKGVNDAIAERVPAVADDVRAAESFASLYERTFPRVYAYVASLVRDRPTAEDVTAQAFERAYRKRRTYRVSKGNPEAWVFGIARNAALDELRRRKRRAGLEVEPEDLATPAAEEQADFSLRREVVRAALAQLSGPERDLVSLKFAGGLSNAEIGSVLGLSESNAGTRLHRTITKLRKACHEAA